MKVTIDRFEGDFCVCEDEHGNMINLKRDSVPQDAGEGSVLIISGSKITVDHEAGRKRREEIEKLTEDMWK